MKIIAVVMVAGLIAGCATTVPPFTGPKGLSLNPYKLTIKWNSADRCKVDSVTEETTTCVAPVPPGTPFCVGRRDFIIWQSTNPVRAKYEIFFDPINGGSLKAGSSGILRKSIDANAPLATYKYSIVRDRCARNLANTYDPRIRVDH